MTTTKRVSHLALSDNGGLFDSATGHTFTLNATGTFIMKRVIAGAAREEIINGLLDEFEVDRAAAEIDLDQFIHYCLELGLLDDDGTC